MNDIFDKIRHIPDNDLYRFIPDNRENAQEGDIVIAIWFNDPNYYIGRVKKVKTKHYNEEHGELFVESKDEWVGFLKGAYHCIVIVDEQGRKVSSVLSPKKCSLTTSQRS